MERRHGAFRPIGGLIVILLMLLVATPSVGAAVADVLAASQGGRQQCFAETGKCARGAFLVYWQLHGGLEQFGYPVGDEIMERNAPPPAGDGQEHLVQYFERARFEFHVDPGKSLGNVKLGLLGSEQWQNKYAGTQPASVQPQSVDDPFDFCARAATVDYPSGLFQGAVVFTGTVRDPDSGALAGLRCERGRPLICTPGASDWACNKVNPSLAPPERTVLYCQIRGGSGAIPMAYVDRTSAYQWACNDGRPVIERQTVTDDQVDARGYRRDAWRALPGGPPPAAPALVGSLWLWQETQMMDGATITVSAPTNYRLALMNSGDLAVRADCNTGSGRYSVNGNELTLTLGPTTALACPEGSQGAVFLNQLGQVASFLIKDSQLYLSLRYDSGIMRFVRSEPVGLVGTDWVAGFVSDGEQSLRSVLPETAPTATFGSDGRVTGSTGCNAFTGRYTVAGDSIAIGPLASTLKACPAAVSTQERHYVNALTNARRYTVDIVSDRLTLLDGDGKALALFSAR